MVRKWFAFLKYILLTGRQKDASPVNERSIIDKYIYKKDENRLKFDISVPHCIYISEALIRFLQYYMKKHIHQFITSTANYLTQIC